MATSETKPAEAQSADEPVIAGPPTNALAIDTTPGAPSPSPASVPPLDPPAVIASSASPSARQSVSSAHTPTDPSSSSPFTPTRIAPPSPAASRRASGNLSRGRSRAGSATSAATGSSSTQSSAFAHGQGSHDRTIRARPPSTLIPQPGDETVPPRDEPSGDLVRSPEEDEQMRAGGLNQDTPLTATPQSRLPMRSQVIIRDYGFAPADERYHGIRVPDVSTPASAASSEAVGSGSAGGSTSRSSRKSSFGGWGGFSLGGFGWGSLRGLKPRRDGTAMDEDDDADVEPEVLSPSSSFDADASQLDAPLDSLDDDDAYPPEDEDEAYEAPSPGPEPKGRYRAGFAFEALGQHEMTVREGEEIDVSGRGGGLGWVLARRIEANRGRDELDEGLVPESYIEAVEG